VMYFQKNFFLIPAINRVIGHLESGGLIEYWHFNYIDKRFLNVKEQEVEARKMSFDHLEGCFQLWGWGCLIAFLCFLVEIIAIFLRKSC
jgi:hypothetical protein